MQLLFSLQIWSNFDGIYMRFFKDIILYSIAIGLLLLLYFYLLIPESMM